MRGKEAIEEIDFFKSQAESRDRILNALQESSVKPDSLRRLLHRHKRADLIDFLFPRPVEEPVFYEHGDAARYLAGCRCPLCREANNEHSAKHRKERTMQAKDPNDPRHGKATFYANHGCRCERCKAAHKDKCAKEYQRRLTTPIDPNDKRHGTHSFYSAYGCRCAPCKAAQYAYAAKRKGK